MDRGLRQYVGRYRRSMTAEQRGLVAFALVYLTFFLDNVLLTVLVPIIPDWVHGGELARWAAQDAPPPLAALLNHTVRHAIAHTNNSHAHTLVDSVRRGGSTAVVGVVLGAKAAAQLAAAPWAARAVCDGAARALGAGTALLAGAAGVFAACGAGGGAWCAGAGRVLHGAGSALAGVAGLALAAACTPRRLPALLGAVALGVLVGYPTGGLLDASWSFLLLAALLLANLGDRQWRRVVQRARRGLRGASARVRWVRAAHHVRHGSAGAHAAALDSRALPPAAMANRHGVRAGQRGLPAGDVVRGAGGARAGRRARGSGGPGRRWRRRARAPARAHGVVAGAAARGAGWRAGRGRRRAGAGAAGARATASAAPRRAATGCFQRCLCSRSCAWRAAGLAVRVRNGAARARRSQSSLRHVSLHPSQEKSAFATVGRQHARRRGLRGVRIWRSGEHAASPAPVYAVAIKGLFET